MSPFSQEGQTVSLNQELRLLGTLSKTHGNVDDGLKHVGWPILERPLDIKRQAKQSLLAQKREARRALRPPTREELDRLLAAQRESANPDDLTTFEFRWMSAQGQEGIVLEVLRRAGMPTHRSVEIGSGLNGANSGLLPGCFGYRSLMCDGNAELIDIAGGVFAGTDVILANEWITREAINALMERHGFSGPIDYLGIDLDGVDYWIWDAIRVCDPILVSVEYNPYFGAEVAVSIPYSPDFSRHRAARQCGAPRAYWGASLAGLVALGVRKGYRLVATASRGWDAFFLKDGICPELRTITPAEGWRSPKKPDPEKQAKAEALCRRILDQGVLAYFADAGWPLTVVG
jgi:hypothetical protein